MAESNKGVLGHYMSMLDAVSLSKWVDPLYRGTAFDAPRAHTPDAHFCRTLPKKQICEECDGLQIHIRSAQCVVLTMDIPEEPLSQ